MKIEEFKGCNTAQEFVDRAGGNLREAENALWYLWYRSGPAGERNQILVEMVKEIVEMKFKGKKSNAQH